MSTDEPVHYLIQRIREALAHDPAVAELELEVTVRGSKVFVSGSVPTEERRGAISEVVARVAPDHDFRNDTQVAILDEHVKEERLE